MSREYDPTKGRSEWQDPTPNTRAQVKRIRIIGLANFEPFERGPVWLKSFEDTPCGRGAVEFTHNESQALTFPGFAEAFEFWRTTSKSVPRRPDGKPNRPLTAYTVEIV